MRQGRHRNGVARLLALSCRRRFVKRPVGGARCALVVLAAMAVCVWARPAVGQTDSDSVRMIPLAPQVEVPPEIGAVDVKVRALGAESVEVAAGGKSSVLIASDSGGTLMLASANEDGGYLGEGPGAVQLGIESTAITLVAVASGRRFRDIDPQLAQAIRSHEEFGRLTRLLEALMASDKNYLDRLYSYPHAVTLIKAVAAGVSVAAPEPGAEAGPGFKQLEEREVAKALAAGDVAAYNSETGVIAPFYKEDFYCIPGSGYSFGLIPCSPWDDSEPWHWYGEALGVRALFPDNFLEVVLFLVSAPIGLAKEYAELVWQSSGALPFPAVAEDTVRGCRSFDFLCRDDGLHATANPNFVNYAMELYEDGVYRDWFYTPGNSTMTDKLLNSGAAYREFRTGPKRSNSVLLSPDIDVVRFQRYRFSLAEGDEKRVDRGAVVSFMNTLHLVIAAVNVITDVSEVREVLKTADIVNLAEPIIECSAEVTTAVSSAFPELIVDGRIVLDADPGKEVQDLILGSLVNLGPAYMGALQSPACQNLLTQAVKGGVSKSVVKNASSVVDDLFGAGSRQVLKTAADAALFWVKLGFDVANEAIPVGLAYFRPAGDRVDYHLFWDENRNGTPYISLVSTSRPPQAQFKYTQRGGFKVELDASQTVPGDSDDLAFSWRVNGTNVGRGERFVHDFGAAGRYRVEVVVIDGNGLSGTFSSGVDVIPGSKPEVLSLECTPTGYQTFRMVASFSDADGDIETVEWRSNAGSVDPDRVTSAGTSQVEMRASDSTTWASVIVEDAVGNRGSRVCSVNLEYRPTARIEIDSLTAACAREEPWRACYHRWGLNQKGLIELAVSMPREPTGTWHVAWCVKEEREGLCRGQHDWSTQIDKRFANDVPLKFPMNPPEGAETFWVVAEVRECVKALCNWPEDFSEVEFHHIEVTLPGSVNRRPEAVGKIPGVTLQAGQSEKIVSVGRYFRDRDGDRLTYSTSVRPEGTVTARESGDTVVLTPLAAGTATVTITARDPGGLTGRQTMDVTVIPPMEFVWISPGEFLMGSTSQHADRDEQPVTRVRISRGFWLGNYEVTQDEWTLVMGDNPSQFSGCGRCPVENISWDDVQTFIAKLNAREGGQRYRLPTEAEWEFAARAGTTTDNYGGELTSPEGNDTIVDRIAWYSKNSGSRTHPVGGKDPNAFGLYDMMGNVWEWVADWYGDYPGGAVADPLGPGSGSKRAGRGGGFSSQAKSCRSARRGTALQDLRDGNLGFRLLRLEGPLNRGPHPVGKIPGVTLQMGESAERVSVGQYFRDPDGDRLTYWTSVRPEGRVTARVSGDTVVLTPLAAGTATVTITAGDPDGLTARQTVDVTVFPSLEFVWVPPGEFLMGSTSQHARSNEQPVTRVRISRGFWLGKYEVTQAEWEAVMGSNPSRFKDCGEDCPVENVSWDDVQTFIAKLNAREGGQRYRLPTEAEFEYAVRAGTTTDNYAGEITNPEGNDPVANRIAWYKQNSGGRTHPVGEKVPNPFGLYDMMGNVWEWLSGWYGDYPGGAVTDPLGPGSGSRRLMRGGAYHTVAGRIRSARRGWSTPNNRQGYLGFRLLRLEGPVNRAPEAVGKVQSVTLQVGDDAMRLVASVGRHFRDPDGDPLTYSTSVRPEGTVTARLSDGTVWVTPVAAGTATVTITARDPDGLTAQHNVEVTVNLEGSNLPVEFEFVWIPPGEFLMGSTSQHADRDEQPVTRVQISRGFWLGKYEVTQAEWLAVMGNNPSLFEDCGGNCPVEEVSWDDVQAFIGKLNAKLGEDHFRLPTEAEWEYAARAGTTTDTYAGDLKNRFGEGEDPVVDKIAWYKWNSGIRTQPVGRKEPNALELYDMMGNVWEWVADRYGYYPGGVVTDPSGPGSGSYRMIRGCAVSSEPGVCRSANRTGDMPDFSSGNLGFRLLRTVVNRRPEVIRRIPPVDLELGGPRKRLGMSSYFRDPDGDRLTYSTSVRPEGKVRAEVVGGTVVLAALATGTARVEITARDPGGLTTQQSMNVTVKERVNRRPEVIKQIPHIDLELGGPRKRLGMSSYFRDPDGDRLTYSTTVRPEGRVTAEVDDGTVVLTARATGTARVEITARDPGGLTTQQSMNVIVTIPGDVIEPPDDSRPPRPPSPPTLPSLTDRQALELIYTHATGIFWKESTNWLTAAPLSSWYGVKTNAAGRVVELKLPNNNMLGILTPGIGALTQLEVLDISGRNFVAGLFPAAMGHLTKLRILKLNNTRIAGTVPAELGHLTNLEELRLDGSNLEGTLPSTLRNLRQLRLFNFSTRFGLCAPSGSRFQAWLRTIDTVSGPTCSP